MFEDGEVIARDQEQKESLQINRWLKENRLICLGTSVLFTGTVI